MFRQPVQEAIQGGAWRRKPMKTQHFDWVPSGNLTVRHGKSPFLIGKAR